ncbi:Rtr1/RPAP2 family-domain-containing protein [Mortierella sp. GBAus27b]|nr:Rtr1/RPAP2 family-domain-containing protein [Mortierella sp. GBAus27b]
MSPIRTWRETRGGEGSRKDRETSLQAQKSRKKRRVVSFNLGWAVQICADHVSTLLRLSKKYRASRRVPLFLKQRFINNNKVRCRLQVRTLSRGTMTTRRVPTMKDDIVVDKSPLIEQYLPRKPNASSSKGRSNDQGESKPEPTRKQVLLQHNLELRKKFESMVLQWQEILCDPVDEDTLGEAANRIKQSHYQEVIEERNIVNLCGYPLCSRPPRDMKGKFRISLQERKVYDITILKKYCSSTCLSASRWIEAQMTEEPIYLNNADPEDLKIVRVSIVPLNMELE